MSSKNQCEGGPRIVRPAAVCLCRSAQGASPSPKRNHARRDGEQDTGQSGWLEDVQPIRRVLAAARPVVEVGTVCSRGFVVFSAGHAIE
jgi:hypothetical protein